MFSKLFAITLVLASSNALADEYFTQEVTPATVKYTFPGQRQGPYVPPTDPDEEGEDYSLNAGFSMRIEGGLTKELFHRLPGSYALTGEEGEQTAEQQTKTHKALTIFGEQGSLSIDCTTVDFEGKPAPASCRIGLYVRTAGDQVDHTSTTPLDLDAHVATIKALQANGTLSKPLAEYRVKKMTLGDDRTEDVVPGLKVAFSGGEAYKVRALLPVLVNKPEATTTLRTMKLSGEKHSIVINCVAPKATGTAYEHDFEGWAKLVNCAFNIQKR